MTEEEEIDNNDDSDPIVKPGIQEPRKAIESFEKFSVLTRFGMDMMKVLKEINREKQDVITNTPFSYCRHGNFLLLFIKNGFQI